MDFPDGSAVKNPPANAGDADSTPGLGRPPWRRKRQPTPVFLPGKSMDRGAWQAIVHGVAKSRTGLGDQHFHFHTVKDSRCGYNLHRVRLVLRTKNLSYRLQMRKS